MYRKRLSRRHAASVRWRRQIGGSSAGCVGWESPVCSRVQYCSSEEQDVVEEWLRLARNQQSASLS
jgi:hypothetical protein